MSEIPENIWQQIQEGDRKSFEILFNKYYKSLCFYAYEIIKDFNYSEEIVSDAFLKIWTQRDNLLIKGSIKNYLFQIIHNRSLNLLRDLSTNKSGIHKKITEGYWKFIEETYIVNDFLLENIFAEEIQKKIDGVIANLPVQCREIFILSRFHGKSNQEIAMKFNLNEATVRVQIFRALNKIRDFLKTSV